MLTIFIGNPLRNLGDNRIPCGMSSGNMGIVQSHEKPISLSDIGMVEYVGHAKLFHGDVINTKTVITFQGKSVDEIEQAFRELVDDYIAWCEEEGAAPEMPFSGKFNLQLSPRLHRDVAVMAKKLKLSVDSFVEKALIDEIKAYKI